MRKLIALFLLISSFAYGQQSNFTNTKFINGVAVSSGAAFPTSGLSAGMLHYKTTAPIGMHYYTGSTWVLISFGGGTVTSITPGWSFTSQTPITSTGTLTEDSTKVQTVANFFPKGDTRYLTTLTGVPSFNTIAAMQAYTGTATAVVVRDSLRGGTFVYNSSALTVDNGTVFTATGKGSGVWQRLYDRSSGLNVLWYGAVPGGVTNSTSAIQAAINYAADFKVKVTIPYGIFLISGLTMNGNDVTLQGAGMSSTQSSYSVTFGGTILKMDATAAVAIAIGSTGSVERVKLSDFTIQGSSTALGGIAVGTASNYVAFSKFDRLQIINFRATNQYGVILNESQENVFDGCQVTHNYYNIYRPDVGYVTSTVFQGGNSYIGFSSIASLYAVGDITDITFRDIIFESDSTQSVKSSANKATITFQNCYFEFGNIKGTATSLIEVLGETGAYGQSSVLLENNVFHAPAVAMYVLKTDYAIAQAKSNRGLFEAGGVSATANSTNIFNFNNLDPAATDLKTLYLGIAGTVIADDKNYTGGRYTIGGINLYGALQVPQMANTATNDSTVVYNAGVLERTLTSSLVVSSAASATTTAITDDVATNATMYPTWVTANTGNLPLKVSSTKMTFNPSTGLLSSTMLTTTSNITGGGEILGTTNNTFYRGRNSTNSAYIPAIGINGSNKVSIDADGVGTIFGGAVNATTFTGALSGNSTTSTTATNLAGGSGGTIPYQSAAGTTAMLANGTAGYVLQANGTTVAPSWVAAFTNPMTTVGDIIYGSSGGTPTRLGVGTTAQFLHGGTTPGWGPVNLNSDISGILPVLNGGTGNSAAGIAGFNNITGYTASGATGTTSTNLVFSTSPTIASPTFTGLVTLSNAAKMMGNTSGGTGSQYVQFANTGADLFIGYNNSTGAGLIGGGNYASNIFTNNATALVLGTNATPALSISSGQVLNVPNLTASQLVATDGSKNLVSVTALPAGTTATTQSAGDNSTKVATTAYVDGAFVPYTGAIANVNIGNNTLTAGGLTVGTGGTGVRLPVSSSGTTTTAGNAEYLILCTATQTMNLQSAATLGAGKTYIIIVTGGAATVTIDPAGGETINGAATKVLNVQYSGVQITSDGSNWIITATF